jgi:hypothetical protein
LSLLAAGCDLVLQITEHGSLAANTLDEHLLSSRQAAAMSRSVFVGMIAASGRKRALSNAR